MKKTSIIITIVLLIFFIIIILVATGAIGFGGYKATIHGTAFYDTINGWGVTYNSCTVAEDSMLTIVPGWYWPWETRDINIVVEITNTVNNYKSDVWIGTISNIVGSKDFDVTFHHIKTGSYTGTIYLYEVEKDFWGVFEKNRVLKATCGSFTFNIGG